MKNFDFTLGLVSAVFSAATTLVLPALGLGLLASPTAYAQQTVGGSVSPGSTLDVKGSVAANYNQVTTATYAMTATDFYVVYNGTTAGTITLPAAGSGVSPYSANFKGRLYSIKNTTAAQTLSIIPNGSETIDGNATISVGAGQSVQLINTGLTAGATWAIVNFNSATATGCVPGYIMATMTAPVQIVTAPTDVQFTAATQNGLSVNPATGVFTLVAGNTYLLQAGLRGSAYSTQNGAFLFRWVDGNNNDLPGNEAVTISNQYATGPTGQQQIATAIYTPTNTVTVKVRIVLLQNGTGALVVDSYAYIHQLNSCPGSSGGTTSLNTPVTVVNTSNQVDYTVLGYIPSTSATAGTSAPATLTVGSATATQQATGTYSGNGHSYAAYSTSGVVTWYEAYNAAKLMGGYLATFTTDGEWQYVETNLLIPRPAFNTNGGWLGMAKFSWEAGPALVPNPEVKWITGEQPASDYSAGGTAAIRKVQWFASNEPNNNANTEGFVHFFSATAPSVTPVTRNGYTSTHPWNDVSATANTQSNTWGFVVEFQQ